MLRLLLLLLLLLAVVLLLCLSVHLLTASQHIDHRVLDERAEHEDQARRHPDVDCLRERHGRSEDVNLRYSIAH